MSDTSGVPTAPSSTAVSKPTWRFVTKKLRSAHKPAEHQYATSASIYATTSDIARAVSASAKEVAA